jgi:hypothetical protein
MVYWKLVVVVLVVVVLTLMVVLDHSEDWLMKDMLMVVAQEVP